MRRAIYHWWGKGFSRALWRLCGPGKCGKDCPKHFSWKVCALSHSWSAVKLHSKRSLASVTVSLPEIAFAQDDFHRVCTLTRRLFWNYTKPYSSAGLQGFLQGGRVGKKPLGWGEEAEAGTRDRICGHNVACHVINTPGVFSLGSWMWETGPAFLNLFLPGVFAKSHCSAHPKGWECKYIFLRKARRT